MSEPIGPIEGRYRPPTVEAQWRGEKGDKGEPGEGITRGARHAVIFLFFLMVALAAANLLWNSHQTSQLTRTQHQFRHALLSQCKFDADLSTAPVTVNPATHKASLLGVQIISDSLVAWHGLGCPGKPPATTASFRRWAAFYHLPAK